MVSHINSQKPLTSAELSIIENLDLNDEFMFKTIRDQICRYGEEGISETSLLNGISVVYGTGDTPSAWLIQYIPMFNHMLRQRVDMPCHVAIFVEEGGRIYRFCHGLF